MVTIHVEPERQRTMTDATDYVTYQIRYLGEVVDESDFLTSGEARAWRDKFCQDLMDGKFPNYLDADDFEDYADCRDQHRVVRVTADCIYEHIPGTYCPCHGLIR